jgi:hypothetical protein
MGSGVLEAQVIKGRLLDNRNGVAVENGTVILLDRDGRRVASAFSDSMGVFAVRVPAPGLYVLRASSLGYRSGFPSTVDLTVEPLVNATIYLDPDPIELDSILVHSDQPQGSPPLAAQGFYGRLQDGTGQFITPEEISRRNPVYFSDLFRGIHGVSVSVNGTVRMRTCVPKIWLDGSLTARGSRLSELVAVNDILAVEVYQRASSIPLQYGGTQGRCAILLWTK